MLKKQREHFLVIKQGNRFFLILLSIMGALAIWIFWPFLTPIVFAAFLAVIFAPFNNWLSRKFFHKKERSNFSAFFTLLFIILVVIIPLIFIITEIYFEAVHLYDYLAKEGTQTEFIHFLNNIPDFLSQYLGDQVFEKAHFTDLFSKILDWLVSHLTQVFSNIFWFVIYSVVLFFGLFYFLRDGAEIKSQLMALSPLEKSENQGLMDNVKKGIHSIFRGSIVVALIQGFLTGVGLAIFGVPSPVLWGSVATLSALIPGIGTALVLIPAIIYLFFTKTILIAVGLLVWGVVVVGLIDHVLRPFLMAPGMRVHPFLIFLSILGGVALMGFVGLILGPLILAFLFALLEIYKGSRKLENGANRT